VKFCKLQHIFFSSLFIIYRWDNESEASTKVGIILIDWVEQPGAVA